MTTRRPLALPILGCFLFLAACASGAGTGVGAAEDRVMVRRSQMLMGTLVFVTAVAPTEAAAKQAVAEGLAEIRRLEELWSTWIPTSEVSRVNAAAGTRPVRVSPETYEMIRRSLRIEKWTGGGFNVAVGPAVDVWGFYDEPVIPSDEELESVRSLIDPAQIQMDSRAQTIFLTRSGMQLDVGGIGKGYAADLATEAMRESGATAAVVALSGDIKTFGVMPDGEPFLFGIEHPRREGAVMATVTLENEAVSTAGDYHRYFLRDGVRYHHILNPATLRPARGCQSVTVVAAEGIMADGLDTGIFVMGPERGMALVESLPGVEAVIVAGDGTMHVSSGLRDRIRLEKVSGQEGAA